MSQSKGLRRDIIDKFYTKESVAKQCISDFALHIDVAYNDIIVEPSAGSGKFIEPIKSISQHSIFLDIQPEHKEIQKQDFLTYTFESLSEYDKIHFIGNPPFGRQSSMAIKFIKHCAVIADTIAFILPKSFKKDSNQKHIPNHFHLIYERNLSENAFEVNGKEYDVPCVFQIWKKKDFTRPFIIKTSPKGFAFVAKEDTPDISFRRVGVNASVISKDIEQKSSQSHYFIKFDKRDDIDSLIDSLKSISFDFDNTVGPKSISKQEMVREFNRVLY